MSFFGSASRILQHLEPQEDDLRASSDDTINNLSASVEYIRDFLHISEEDIEDDDLFDEESDNYGFPEFSQPKPTPIFVTTSVVKDQCSVCYCDYEDCDGKVLLDCGHAFGANCLRSYLSMVIKETANFKHQISMLVPGRLGPKLIVRTIYGVNCPSYKCQGVICGDTIRSLAAEEIFHRFDRFCLQQTLEELHNDGALKLCESCQNGYIQADCLCSDPYCRQRTIKLRTLEEQRRYKRWERENAKSHMMFGIWMSKTNIKCCPKCFKAIEKNMGCDHMYCTQCKHSFLWSQAPAYGTGLHWWRPQETKTSKSSSSAAETTNGVAPTVISV